MHTGTTPFYQWKQNSKKKLRIWISCVMSAQINLYKYQVLKLNGKWREALKRVSVKETFSGLVSWVSTQLAPSSEATNTDYCRTEHTRLNHSTKVMFSLLWNGQRNILLETTSPNAFCFVSAKVFFCLIDKMTFSLGTMGWQTELPTFFQCCKKFNCCCWCCCLFL